MSELIQTGFDYAALPVETALVAKTSAERIKLRIKRTVEDIIEIGRDLTAVKDKLPHGQFLPWIAAEFEMSRQTADNFTSVYERFGNGKVLNFSTFKPSILYALSAPSTPETVIDQAIEHAESGENVTVADVKKWKEEARILSERAEEFRAESNERRKTIRELESQIGLLKSQPPEIQVQTPSDYEATKDKAEQLETELANLKSEQAKLISKQVNSQVNAKLHQYQSEVDEMEKRKDLLQDKVDRMKEYLASLDGEARRIETHQTIIEELRLKLIGLAAFLSDEEPIQDADTVKRWLALAGMCDDAKNAIESMFGKSPRLAVVRSDAA